MRANKYLYIVPLDDDVHFVIFNGLNKEFLILEEKARATRLFQEPRPPRGTT